MTRTTPVRWLRTKATEGLVELPSNAAWLIGKAFPDGESSPSETGSQVKRAHDKGGHEGGSMLRNSARKIRIAAADSLSFVPDSLEARISQAQEAVSGARAREEQAMHAAEDARSAAENASEVAAQGARRLEAERADCDEMVRQRVAEAQATADEMVARERAEAERDGEERVKRTREEVDATNAKTQKQADQVRADAQQQVDDAAARMADARRLADEAAKAAQEAADAAHREADRLAKDASHHSGEADQRLADTRDLEREVTLDTAHTVRESRESSELDGLEEQTRAQLLDLAAGLGVEGRSHLRKAQLVTAVKKATAAAR